MSKFSAIIPIHVDNNNYIRSDEDIQLRGDNYWGRRSFTKSSQSEPLG